MSQENVETEMIRDIMPGDGMYAYAPELYFKAGEDAVALMHEALAAAGVVELRRILNFACGAGRVMRAIKVRGR